MTHFVVGVGMTVGGERTYVTQGDSNEVPDAAPVRDVQVGGAVWYSVPYLGYLAGAFTGQREATGVVVAVLLLGYAGCQVLRAARERSARATELPVAVGSGDADGDGLAGRVAPAAEAGPVGPSRFRRPSRGRSCAMTPGRRMALVTVLVAGSALAVLPAQAAVPAATDDRLVLSRDGRTWAPDVTTPMLDPDLIWVPGDVVVGTLYARNVSGENASAVATVHLDGGPDGAGDPLVDELNVRTRMGAAPWADGPTSVITDLPPGEEIPIGIEVELDPAASSASRQQTARIDVAVTLSAVGQGQDGEGGPSAGGPDGLPRTGSDLLALALLAAGAVAVGMRLRRRTRRD